MAVTYEYYRIFYYVAKCQSFTGAARLLMNSQPNITRAMNNLEQMLGCKLFIRSHHGVQLTPEGEKLFAHVRIAHEQLQLAEQELSDDLSLQAGTISISVSEIALHGLLLPTLKRFHEAYPNVRIRLYNHSTPQAVEAVKRGMAELAVVTTPTDAEKPLTEERLMPYQDVLVASHLFSALRERAYNLKEISRYPIICLGRETQTFAFYSRLFAQYDVNLMPDVELATTDQILPVVRSGLGLGFLPAFFVRESIEKGEVFEIRLKDLIPRRSICMVKNQERPLSFAATALERLLKEASCTE